MCVRPAEVEGLVSLMAIDAFEVRACRGMSLYITLNVRGSYAEEECTMATCTRPRSGGLLSMVTCWMAEECTRCAYLVDKNDVGLDGMQTVVNVVDEYGHTLMILRSVSHG
jgi:hypothetical protein